MFDYGCGDGLFLRMAASLLPLEAHGFDKDAGAIERARAMAPDIRFHDSPDEVDDGSIDVVTMFDVLEHIYDQDAALRIALAKLKPGGTLVVTVPQRHFFSVFDPGNFKFRFPRLNKLAVTAIKGAEYYRKRFSENPYGMIGDVEAAKGWHEHFTEEGLRSLLVRNGFEPGTVEGSGLFGFFLQVFGRLTRIPLSDWLFDWDTYRFSSQMLYMTATKPDRR